MTDPFRLLLIGDSDSQLLACEALCRFPEDLAVEVTINAIPGTARLNRSCGEQKISVVSGGWRWGSC